MPKAELCFSKVLTCNRWLGQIDPPLCLFVVAVATTTAVVDATATGGLTGLAAAIRKNSLCGPKAVLPNFFLVFSPPLYFPMPKSTLNLNSSKSGS